MATTLTSIRGTTGTTPSIYYVENKVGESYRLSYSQSFGSEEFKTLDEAVDALEPWIIKRQDQLIRELESLRITRERIKRWRNP